ncbi:hypothetical protein B0E46_07805 [Rhodanobacter sp. B04]|nr:hypothetical protein B0E46_07805 [Rhodanobacter sp. B04]
MNTALVLFRRDLRPADNPAWSAACAAAHWQPDEAGARELLDIFGDDAIGDYAHTRDLPSRHGTARLSPHLHFGEIQSRWRATLSC